MSTSERTEVLAAIRQVSLLLSSVNGHFGIQGETCYWATSYHFNIRLYEKLLFGIFDILDEGNFIEVKDCYLLSWCMLLVLCNTETITQLLFDLGSWWISEALQIDMVYFRNYAEIA